MKTHSGFWFRWAWPVIGCALASLTALAQAGGRDADEWFESDLGAVQSVRALQINYADQDAEFAGKPVGSDHAYRLFASRDGKTWKLIVDKSENRTDVPHDYVELARPVEARFVRLENVHIPTGRFALSGLRVFGTGHGGRPAAVEHFTVLRGDSERRNAWLKWQTVDEATGYLIYAGASPEKLYTSVMVLGTNNYYFRALDRDEPHYFQIEAFNENGVSVRSEVLKVKSGKRSTLSLQPSALSSCRSVARVRS